MSKFFTISIGSNGSIVLLNTKSKILENFVIEDITDTEIQNKVIDLFKKHKKVPIYFILDNVGQNYNKKIFPDVGFFDLQSLVKRKFNYEIPKDDLKDKRFLGRNKKTRNWEYMFISSPIDEVMSIWLDIINNKADNILAGIYMLPLETEGILKKIKRKLNIKKEQLSLDIVLIENRVSGFREITFINNKLSFTRILTQNLENQEKFNTQFNENISRNIDYLKRFYTDFDSKDLNIYTITSNAFKNFMNNLDTKDKYKIKSFSFLDFSVLFGLKKKIEKFIEFGDILFEEMIMFSKKTISFSTKDMKQLVFLSFIGNIFGKFRFVVFLFLIFSFFYSFLAFTKYTYKIEEAKKNYEKVVKDLDNKKKEEFGSDVLNIDEIVDITSFYSDVKIVNKNPFAFLIDFSKLFPNGELIVTNINFRINNLLKNNLTYSYKNIILLDVVIMNKSGKIDDLFKIYENINNTLKTSMTKYNIVLSDLPKNINFNTNYFTFPIKVTFSEK